MPAGAADLDAPPRFTAPSGSSDSSAAGDAPALALLAAQRTCAEAAAQVDGRAAYAEAAAATAAAAAAAANEAAGGPLPVLVPWEHLGGSLGAAACSGQLRALAATQAFAATQGFKFVPVPLRYAELLFGRAVAATLPKVENLGMCGAYACAPPPGVEARAREVREGGKGRAAVAKAFAAAHGGSTHALQGPALQGPSLQVAEQGGAALHLAAAAKDVAAAHGASTQALEGPALRGPSLQAGREGGRYRKPWAPKLHYGFAEVDLKNMQIHVRDQDFRRPRRPSDEGLFDDFGDDLDPEEMERIRVVVGKAA